ncbi:MAG: hypothetical protein IPK26_07235 [Planctomycetes bacterium]|nr:hypothetical protein [Planctomycetota bacterium]
MNSYEYLRLLLVALGMVVIDTGRVVAQRTWVVSGSPGYPADFTDLPLAVAAAAPGDTIQIVAAAGGIAVDYTAARIDKPLHIVGCWSGFARPTVPASALGVSFRGLFDISGVPAGQTLTLSNLSVDPPTLLTQAPWVLPAGIRATDCAGRIVVENVWLHGFGLQNFQFSFDRCADVTLHRIESYSGAQSTTIVDSNVTMSWASMYGVQPIQVAGFGRPPYATGTPPPTMEIRNSHVQVWDSYVEGSDGWLPGGYFVTIGRESHAVWVRSGTLDIGPAAWFIGGRFPGFNEVNGALIEPGAVVRKDDRGVCWQNQTQPLTLHTVSHATLVQDYPYQVRVFGPRNGFAFLGVGAASLGPSPLGFGDLWIDLPSLSSIGLAPLDNVYGEYWYNLYCPRNVPEAFVYAFQAAMIAPDGTLAMTPPSRCTVAWAFDHL